MALSKSVQLDGQTDTTHTHTYLLACFEQEKTRKATKTVQPIHNKWSGAHIYLFALVVSQHSQAVYISVYASTVFSHNTYSIDVASYGNV